jgi:hypothetical protein
VFCAWTASIGNTMSTNSHANARMRNGFITLQLPDRSGLSITPLSLRQSRSGARQQSVSEYTGGWPGSIVMVASIFDPSGCLPFGLFASGRGEVHPAGKDNWHGGQLGLGGRRECTR